MKRETRAKPQTSKTNERKGKEDTYDKKMTAFQLNDDDCWWFEAASASAAAVKETMKSLESNKV